MAAHISPQDTDTMSSVNLSDTLSMSRRLERLERLERVERVERVERLSKAVQPRMPKG